jgi:transposase
MYYPPAVQQKAQRLEQLLVRLEAGEPLDQLCAALGFKLTRKRISQLQAKYEAGGRSWQALQDGRFGHYQQVNTAVRAYLYERKQQDDQLTAGQLASEVTAKFGVTVSEGHVNHVLRQVALTRPPGRPGPKSALSEPTAPPDLPVANAGLFFPGRGEAGAGDHAGGDDLPDRSGSAAGGGPA